MGKKKKQELRLTVEYWRRARAELYKIDNQDDQLNFLCQNNNVYIYN